MSDEQLTLISRRPIDIPSDAPVVLCVVKNEALRLPYFLRYYRNIGFGRFVFIDNASTDGTRELLLAAPDAIVFRTEGHFGAGMGAGLHWKHAVLDRFLNDRWVLVADADEILVWPSGGNEDIRALAQKMTASQAEALFVLMIDMYSDKAFGEIGYRAGEAFIDYAPYFDGGRYSAMPAPYCPFVQVWGGVRERIWKSEGEASHPPMIGKVPFLRWRAGQQFVAAQHLLERPVRLAPMRGALLHFKMLDDLAEKCARAIEGGQYYQQSREYRVLQSALEKSPGKTFFDPAISLRYQGTEQLLALDFMRQEKGVSVP